MFSHRWQMIILMQNKAFLKPPLTQQTGTFLTKQVFSFFCLSVLNQPVKLLSFVMICDWVWVCMNALLWLHLSCSQYIKLFFFQK